ncbi:hypothetical protein N7G274_002943 [Stereocaulon virgatum]|uniref:TRAM domain-containing protein n=1 Tax=Stereocaulon virgatum TaxID=373712 RepID=A0ABR4AGM9_9LECA
MRGSIHHFARSVSVFKSVRRPSPSHGLAAMTRKPYNEQYHSNKSAKRQKKAAESTNDGSNEDVLLVDVMSLLSLHRPFEKSNEEDVEHNTEHSPKKIYIPPKRFSEIEVEISQLSSTGDGLGISSTYDHVYVVPFTIPGDLVQARIVDYFPKAGYTLTDFVKVITPAPQRDDSLSKCPYFAKCAGCQIQMLPYELQLQHKKDIVEKAYRNFSTLTPDIIPAVAETIGSPLQYGYRTKLTPHFDGPPGSLTRHAKRNPSQRKGLEAVPALGFNMKATRKVIDIEDCPIGTDAVREGLKCERKKLAEEFAKYTTGATILLRESTVREPKSPTKHESPKPVPIRSAGDLSSNEEHVSSATANGNTGKPEDARNSHAPDDTPPYTETKTYITDQRAKSTEYVDNFVFKNTAGAFFQNNNSILATFTAYIRDRIIPPTTPDNPKPIKYLIDAYCGSGLFTITLSSLFSSSMGIDIAGASIVSAKENAAANNISNEAAAFMTADASKLFEHVRYPPDETVVIIDPPRKGCDDAFLQQLLKFGPRRVVYVSCNVHTQARDVGVLVEGVGDCRYGIESLQGFDFFPQTGHVEGVAILARCN